MTALIFLDSQIGKLIRNLATESHIGYGVTSVRDLSMITPYCFYSVKTEELSV